MKLLMSDDELRVRYRQAKNRKRQISILAQCNATTEAHIRYILDGGKGDEWKLPRKSDRAARIRMKQKACARFIDYGTKSIKWTDENIEILRMYLEAGYTFSAISECTGVKVNTLTNASIRFGITKKELKKRACTATNSTDSVKV